MAVHPRALVEAFWNFQMPLELVHGFGLPELTPEIKRGILGENAARIVGLDIDTIRREIEDDEFSRREELAEPWSRATAQAVT
jgi:uncharacterized protein